MYRIFIYIFTVNVIPFEDADTLSKSVTCSRSLKMTGIQLFVYLSEGVQR